MKKASVIVAALAMICVWVGSGSKASAQANEAPAEQPATTQQAVKDYDFVAQPGNSMSVMARKAVQLFDQKTDDITLPEPCIVAAETNIVQSLGPRWLEIGEKLHIDESVVADFARKAQALTDEQRAAWKVYSDNADFTLADVKLASEVVAAQQGNVNGTPGQDQNQTNAEPTPAENQQSSTDQPANDSTENNTTNGSAPWYWWVVGVGTIGALYYLLGGRSGTKENTSSK